MKDKKDKNSDDSETEKILISFYLSSDTLEKFDDVLFYARKSLPMDKRRKLTKSAVYEIGVRMVIEDFHKKSKESLLWQAIDKLIQP